jgi:phospholipase D1/2
MIEQIADNYLVVQVNALVFAHHQKCVIVDTQGSGNNRKITTFIGGLDLCDGRYDTPEHRLFRDRETVYQNDDFNPTLLVSNKGNELLCKSVNPCATPLFSITHKLDDYSVSFLFK